MKDETYHESAIYYNDVVATSAEQAADVVLSPTVQKWCRAVASQHRYHEKRHRAALEKLRRKTAKLAEKEQQDG